MNMNAEQILAIAQATRELHGALLRETLYEIRNDPQFVERFMSALGRYIDSRATVAALSGRFGSPYPVGCRTDTDLHPTG